MDRLFRIKIESVKPFALMLAPIYLWLGANEKFISLKAPLDFFTADELKRLRVYQYFYLPESAGTVLPFRQAAHQVRALLGVRPARLQLVTSEGQYPAVPLSPAPYELSNEILKIIGPLWWADEEDRPGIEPFLVTAFVNEFCNLIPEAKLYAAREKDIRIYERALMCSSWTVFLALLLGYSDFTYLNSLRLKAFDQAFLFYSGGPLRSGRVFSADDELIELATELLGLNQQRIGSADFEKRGDRLSLKILSRLERISRELVGRGVSPPTVYGEEGFIDA